MTDIKLTPSSIAAFTEALKGESGSLDAWLEVNDESEVAAHIEAYASACVVHATAQLQTEIAHERWLREQAENRCVAVEDQREALRAEVERANSWNARVSVCRDHVADIVDGLCVICSLRAAEERADNLQEEVERVTCELMDAITRADKLAEALRLALDSHGVMLMTDPPQDAWKVHRVEEIGRALLREQDKGGGYWPEMPKNGGPDWTGFDG